MRFRANIAEDWYRRTALCDLLQLGDEEVNKDRLYRALDHLLMHKAAIEAHLSRRCGELFAVQNEVLLYDVTSTYFEGEAEANPLAQRGYSRDHRPDCKQVCIALVVTFDGFPLGYEVFAGNTHDSRTLQTIVATMEARHGVLGRVWIADRGMASAVNLAWLRQTGRRYIIGAPKSELKKFGSELVAADGWRTVQEGVEVKLTRHPATEETVILCRSADRRSKEQAMHDRFSRRIETALERLAARVARSKRRLDPAPVNRQIGRILQRNQIVGTVYWAASAVSCLGQPEHQVNRSTLVWPPDLRIASKKATHLFPRVSLVRLRKNTSALTTTAARNCRASAKALSKSSCVLARNV